MWRTFILLIAGLGCAIPQKHVELIRSDKPLLSVVTYPTELRGAYLAERNGTVFYCAEPSPDVAFDTLQKVTADLTLKLPAGQDLTAKSAAEINSKVVQLAGRTQLILLARELLYRACELNFNYLASDKNPYALYDRVASVIEKLGEADRAGAEADKARAQADLVRARFDGDESSKCIDSWLEKDSANVQVLKQWLKDKAKSVSLALFTYGKEYAEKRAAFIREKQISCE